MIFADSSYFIALVNRKDQWHEDAIRLMSQMPEKLIVTDYVIAECVTSVGALGGGKAGLDLYESISDNCEIVYIDKGLLEKSMKIYIKFDGTLSVSDAVSVQLMREKKIKRIASFDSDFDRIDGIIRLS